MASTVPHDWRPAGAGADTAGQRHVQSTGLPYTFGHLTNTTARQDKAEAAAQEKTDARWWLGGAGGAATMNGARNRDITAFWQHAEESHADVRSNLNEAARANRLKGLSSAGSKAALAGDPNRPPETCSLYKTEFGTLKPKSAEMAARMAVLQEAARESHTAAVENKRQSSGSNLTLATDF